MQLNYKTFGEGFPVIILHGLLGSLDNWQSIAKKMAEKNFKVFIVDQRNHGKSPHTDDFSYEILANDLLDFFNQHAIAKAHVVGHSMGGKTAMLFALMYPEKVEKLVISDIAPTEYEDGHTAIFQALYAADAAHATSREQVQKALEQKLANDKTTIGFLMKGLDRDATGKHFIWKFNIDALWKNYDKISGAVDSNHPFTGKTLFIKGAYSNYIHAGNYPEIMRLFPDNQLVEIAGAGHWVHADNPTRFIEEVEKFLAG
jgi:esterase